MLVSLCVIGFLGLASGQVMAQTNGVEADPIQDCLDEASFEARAHRLLFKYPTRSISWKLSDDNAGTDFKYVLELFEYGELLVTRQATFESSGCHDADEVLVRMIDRYLLSTTPEDEVLSAEEYTITLENKDKPAETTSSSGRQSEVRPDEEVGKALQKAEQNEQRARSRAQKAETRRLESEAKAQKRHEKKALKASRKRRVLEIDLAVNLMAGLGLGGIPEQRPIFGIGFQSFGTLSKPDAQKQSGLFVLLGLEASTHRSLSFNEQRIGNERYLLQVGPSYRFSGDVSHRLSLAGAVGMLNSRGVGFDETNASSDTYAEAFVQYGRDIARNVGFLLRVTRPLTRHRFQIQNIGTVAEVSAWVGSLGLTLQF